jgi:alpha-galactosidase
MLKFIVALLGLTSSALSLAAQRESDLAGAWATEITLSTPQQQLLVFNHRGTDWTGTMTTRFGTMKLEAIVVDGDNVSFSQVLDLGLGPVAPIRVQGVLRADVLHLRMPTGSSFFDRIARRAGPREVTAIEAATPSNARLTTLPANGLARTPPMGWNSWNHFEAKIDDKTVREIADALVTTGLRDAGYVYVNVDDTWQGKRDANGVLHPNSKFPDMKAIADYVHSRGLKFGLYSSPGTRTCADYEGSYGHEEQDAQAYASWGVDYLKYDWCSAESTHSTPAEMQAAYLKMGVALQAAGRPITYSLCQYGLFDVGRWGRNVGGNLWRTTGDIQDYWASMEEIGFSQNGRESDAGPGAWNDPDMLEVGNGGMSREEYRTHLTLWSMLSAPLLLGNDIRSLTPETKALVANKEVIAIDQDPLGIQARRISLSGLPASTEAWLKPLSDGSEAVALFNRGSTSAEVALHWLELGLPSVAVARDLWQQVDVPAKAEGYRATLPPHGSVLLRVTSVQSGRSVDAQVRSSSTSVNIVYIGDSITEGMDSPNYQGAAAVSAELLRKTVPGEQISIANLGRSGHTTVDALPASQTDFLEIERAAAKLQSDHPGQLIFSIMLGTNDSAEFGPLGSPVAPQAYRSNLAAIIDRLLEDYRGCKVVIHRPTWYSPNTYNGSRYLAEGLARLQSYFPEIDALVAQYDRTHPRQVLRGDTRAFDFFKRNYKTYLIPEEGQQGTFYLHPNSEGARSLGRFWADAIQVVLQTKSAEVRTPERSRNPPAGPRA